VAGAAGRRLPCAAAERELERAAGRLGGPRPPGVGMEREAGRRVAERERRAYSGEKALHAIEAERVGEPADAEVEGGRAVRPEGRRRDVIEVACAQRRRRLAQVPAPAV